MVAEVQQTSPVMSYEKNYLLKKYEFTISSITFFFHDNFKECNLTSIGIFSGVASRDNMFS